LRQIRQGSVGRAKALVVAVALIALGGCAAPGHRPVGDRALGDPAPSLTAPPASPSQPIRTAPPAASDWVDYAADVTGLRPGPTDRSAIIEVSLTAGRDDCARGGPRVTYQEETATAVIANVVYSSAGNATVGACPYRRPAEVTLTSTAPLAGRSVSLNSMSTWILDGTRYRRCDTHLVPRQATFALSTMRRRRG
jgi:hypothetical protein